MTELPLIEILDSCETPSMFSAGDRVVIIKTGRLMAYNQNKRNWKKLHKLKFKAGSEGVCVGEGRFILTYG